MANLIAPKLERCERNLLNTRDKVLRGMETDRQTREVLLKGKAQYS
jgi:hypothetical protein